MSEHRSECGGWWAVWRLDRAGIRIMRVDARTPGIPPLLAVDIPTSAPDLASMRERFPDLSPLWDAVRRDYWHVVSTPPIGDTR
ncbi:hypothetical protein IU510_06830 [Nocardia cyriacigeorgica]|uniref:hypothetical protein n=1 Tax=Nocardia cyriacigeorgica TaxID=135487 RepID=UPI001892F549|nr:hypothetical protein [Nocardia cyriacigeorgica]MBF6097791.1 hypothetical protein [Nocardia cyriacigeorgica]MBF6161566.1 hypothetical protein [Nocardia cyriacigeorgica]MBF6200364.1 hypothetical protein [Nocardia cyriacigeorgica]